MFEKYITRLVFVLFALIIWLAAKPAHANDALIYYSTG